MKKKCMHVKKQNKEIKETASSEKNETHVLWCVPHFMVSHVLWCAPCFMMCPVFYGVSHAL